MVLSGVITGVLLVGGAVALGPLARRRPVRAVAVVVCVGGAGLVLRSLVADHWTEMTPRSVLAYLLERAEPYPKRLAQTSAPGARPEPNPDDKRSDDRWERLRWHHQYGHAARAWYERVRATPPEQLHTLVPHARRMQELTKEGNSTRWVDAWPSSRMEARLREWAETDDAEVVLAMRRGETPAGLRAATWAITELQSLETGTPEMRWGFVPPPMEVLGAIADAGLAAGDDQAVRYAIDRAAAIKSAGAQALLERLAVELAGGPDGEPAASEAPAGAPLGALPFDAETREALAKRLTNALQWRASFAPPQTWVEADAVAAGGDADGYDLPAVPSP